MERFKSIIKRSASMLHLPKLAMILPILLAFNLTMPLQADAQRRGGGGGRSFGGGSFNHSGSSVGRINNSNFGHEGFSGRGFHNYRGFSRYRGVPYWRYAYLPFWGDYYWGIPPYSLRFYLDGYNYYDHDGVYYKYEKDKYKVVPAPIGYKVKVLPKGSLHFTVDGNEYYYYFGSYYVPRDGKYEVVQPPVGAEVDSIPDGYDKVMIDGQTYYTLNGVQYKAVLRDNVVWYQVIKNNVDNDAQSSSTNNDQPVQDNDTGDK